MRLSQRLVLVAFIAAAAGMFVAAVIENPRLTDVQQYTSAGFIVLLAALVWVIVEWVWELIF